MDLLTSDQLSEWEAYDRLDPIGTWREDYRMAYIAAILTNLTIAVHGKKGAKQAELRSFMPNWSGEEEYKAPQSVEEMKEVFKAIVQASKEAQKKNEILKKKQHTPPTKKKQAAIQAEQTGQITKDNG